MILSKHFYLIRHGESEANIAKVAAGGGVDSLLTENGRAQAKALASLVTRLPYTPTHIYHSSLVRARETAELLNSDLKLNMTNVHGLREHELGELEGKPWDYVLPFFEGLKDPPGGETMDAFGNRVKQHLNWVLEQDPNGVPLIVAHGGTFHAFSRLYGRIFTEVHNCKLHHFQPYTKHEPFPWKISMLHLNEEGGIRIQQSPSCALYNK